MYTSEILSIGQNKRDNVRTERHWGAFVQTLLQWKSSKY